MGQCADVPANPGGPEAFAGYGSACVVDAAGTVALVSGPGFDSGDGLVRAFERDGGGWVEGPAFGALFQFGDNFGHALALSDDGLTAVVTAPREPSVSGGLQLAAGGAYVYERDAGSGVWSQTLRFEPPAPGAEKNFGASCAISGDGSTIVIGETNVLGSDWAFLPDAAWVSTRQGNGWGPLIELVPSPAPPAGYNFGHAVEISEDGTLIAVSAPLAPAFSGNSGRVYVFELQGGSWVQTDVLERTAGADSFSNFGLFLAFDGSSLLTHNPYESGDGGPPICIYERSAGAYPATPNELLLPPSASPQRGRLVVRGDTLLLCTIAQDNRDGLTVFRRAADDPGRTWAFEAFYTSEDPSPFGSTGYGFSAAVAEDPSVLVVGEPFWSSDDNGFLVEGRINFPDRVFTTGDFAVMPGTSSVQITIDFPGLATQFAFLQLVGGFDLTFPVNCDGSDTPVQIVVDGVRLNPTEDEFVLDGPGGVPVRVSGLSLDLVEPSEPAAVDQFGQALLTGMVLRVEATMRVGMLPPVDLVFEEPQDPVGALVFGSGFGLPPRFQIPDLDFSVGPDIGLGDNNPTLGVTGSVFTELDDSCDADLAEPFGVLNFFDVAEFVSLFNQQDPAADFAEPFGEFNFFDVAAYIGLFNAGCP